MRRKSLRRQARIFARDSQLPPRWRPATRRRCAPADAWDGEIVRESSRHHPGAEAFPLGTAFFRTGFSHAFQSAPVKAQFPRYLDKHGQEQFCGLCVMTVRPEALNEGGLVNQSLLRLLREGKCCLREQHTFLPKCWICTRGALGRGSVCSGCCESNYSLRVSKKFRLRAEAPPATEEAGPGGLRGDGAVSAGLGTAAGSLKQVAGSVSNRGSSDRSS